MFFLSKNGVESLVLELPEGEKYKLPSAVFRCSKMRYLVLHHCLINPSPSFEEFSRLICLKLFNVTISAKSLENLISCCPLLECLELEISDPLNFIEVNAPQLRYFYFGSKINSLCFKNTTLLADVAIAMGHPLDHGSSVERGKCDFAEFFGSLPAVKDLRLDICIIKVKVNGTNNIYHVLSHTMSLLP